MAHAYNTPYVFDAQVNYNEAPAPSTKPQEDTEFGEPVYYLGETQAEPRKRLEQRETKRRDERKTNMKVVGKLVAALAVVTFALYSSVKRNMEKLNEEVSKISKNVEDSIEDFRIVAQKYDAEDLIERVKRSISMEVVFRVDVDDSGVCIPDNRYPQFERKITEFDEEMINCISELKKRVLYKVVVDTAVSPCVII